MVSVLRLDRGTGTARLACTSTRTLSERDGMSTRNIPLVSLE
jgi:hypothetical protein